MNTLADSIKRLREEYTDNRANFLEITAINQLVELVEEMRTAVSLCVIPQKQMPHVYNTLTKADALLTALKE